MTRKSKRELERMVEELKGATERNDVEISHEQIEDVLSEVDHADRLVETYGFAYDSLTVGQQDRFDRIVADVEDGEPFVEVDREVDDPITAMRPTPLAEEFFDLLTGGPAAHGADHRVYEEGLCDG